MACASTDVHLPLPRSVRQRDGYAIVVSVSLFFSVILAKLVGGMLPLAAKKLGADPAIMATPFITTIVDACSLILYFQIAQLVFRNMM